MRATGQISLLYLITLFVSISSQDCDSSNDTAPCSEGQICLDRSSKCERAVSYSNGLDCGGSHETFCVADYCQPLTCTATGQCVYGQKCSQNAWYRSCVYPVILKVEEKTEVVLNFTEPGSRGSYEEITWYKNQTRSGQYRIAWLHPVTGGEPKYYNEFCSGSSSCETSSKGELNVDTGELTIYSVTISDEGFYYYEFYIEGGIASTGHNYEIQMEVYVTPKQEDITLIGIPDDFIGVGTDLYFMCAINLIKPVATDIHWMTGGQRDNGSDIRTDLNDDGTFRQSTTLLYKVTKEDDGKTIKCVVVPAYGDIISVEQTVNPGYGPTGSPKVDPSVMSKYVGEIVVLTCNKPDDDGNPDCNIYTWNRIEGSDGIPLPVSKTMVFVMNESWAGNYTCTCGNNDGTSDVSNAAEVRFLTGSKPTKSYSTGPIIGGIIGVLALILLVVVIVLICRRYKLNNNIKLTKKGTQQPISVDESSVTVQQGEGHSPAYDELDNLPGNNQKRDTTADTRDRDGYLRPVASNRNYVVPHTYEVVKEPVRTRNSKTSI